MTRTVGFATCEIPEGVVGPTKIVIAQSATWIGNPQVITNGRLMFDCGPTWFNSPDIYRNGEFKEKDDVPPPHVHIRSEVIRLDGKEVILYISSKITPRRK